MSAATAPTRGRPERRPLWTWLLPLMSVVLAAAIPLLVWYALSAILDSTDGTVQEVVTDPAAPGYEATVNPSPSHMVLSLDPAGDLAMVTILSLGSNDIGGTVLHIAPETVLSGNPNFERIIDAYRLEGPDRTRLVVANLIDVNVDELTVLDEAQWQLLTQPVGSIPVDIDTSLTELGDDGPTVIYPAGNVIVAPSDVSSFLGWVNPGEHPIDRAARHEAFWQAWLARITASDDPNIVPGEVESGIGRFVRGIAASTPLIEVPPGTPVTLDSGVPGTEIDIAGLRLFVAEMIPFPLPASPGDRPTVKLLDGVGQLDLAGVYTPPIVRNRGRVITIGNVSPAFGVEQTSVIYHDRKWEAEALAIAEALGATSVDFESEDDVVFDVTVIIGEDQGLALGE